VFALALNFNAAVTATNSLTEVVELRHLVVAGLVELHLEAIGPVLAHEGLGSRVVDVVNGGRLIQMGFTSRIENPSLMILRRNLSLILRGIFAYFDLATVYLFF
jgi:hypothetical protein